MWYEAEKLTGNNKTVCARARQTRHRCLTHTLGDGNVHDPQFMIDPDFFRPLRGLEDAERILDECATKTSRTARQALTDLLAIWAETPALMGIPHFHAYLQTVGDSLHIFDGGLTERILVYIGNWLYTQTGEGAAEGKNWEAVQLVNNRLAASPPQQEFKHFVQPLYAKNEDAKKSTAHQPIKMAANWRCIEFEALLPQMPYLLKEHPEIVNVLMAYADLYKTLRDVAPLLSSVTTAMRECAQPEHHANCFQTQITSCQAQF